MKNQKFLYTLLLGVALANNTWAMDKRNRKEEEENTQDSQKKSKIDLSEDELLVITKFYKSNDYNDQEASVQEEKNNEILQSLIDNNREIILKSVDGHEIRLLIKHAIYSITLKELILDTVNEDGMNTVIIPLQTITKEILDYIVEALHIITTKNKPVINGFLRDKLKQLDLETIKQILLAANFLDIQELVDVATTHIAHLCKRKKPIKNSIYKGTKRIKNSINIDYFEQLSKKLSTEIINKTRDENGITFLEFFIESNNYNPEPHVIKEHLDKIIQNAICCGIFNELMLTPMKLKNLANMPLGSCTIVAYLVTDSFDMVECMQQYEILEQILFTQNKEENNEYYIGACLLVPSHKNDNINLNHLECFLELLQQYGFLERLFTLHNNNGTTALEEACIRNNFDIVKLFVQYGAPITKEAIEKAELSNIKEYLVLALIQQVESFKKLVNEYKK